MADGEEIDRLRPYLELAREMRAEVDRVAAGDPTTGDALEAAIVAVPERERRRLARAVFDRLAPEEQWAVLERLFDDDEIRAHLAEVRARRHDDAARRAADVARARAARAAGRIELERLPAAVEVAIGLVRPDDVRLAVARGPASSACARELAVRTTGDRGRVRVLTDVFNPRHGYFVTAEYDQAVWATERLASHDVVRLGSARLGGDGFEPALYAGGRVDVEVDGEVRPGRLHLGFALIGGEDVFAATT